MAASVESADNPRATHAEPTAPISLAEAAERIGCHVETLRRLIRSGQLPALRGPHGRFYVDPADLNRIWIRPSAGRRGRLDGAGSWSAVASVITAPKRSELLGVLERLRATDPNASRSARLIAAFRLRLMGRTYREIAAELGLSERQVRRLAHRDPAAALVRELKRERIADLRRRRHAAPSVIARLESELRRSGYAGPVRSEVTRRTGQRTRIPLYRTLTADQRTHLLSLALTDDEIEAIELAGIPRDAFSLLMSLNTPIRVPNRDQ